MCEEKDSSLQHWPYTPLQKNASNAIVLKIINVHGIQWSIMNRSVLSDAGDADGATETIDYLTGRQKHKQAISTLHRDEKMTAGAKGKLTGTQSLEVVRDNTNMHYLEFLNTRNTVPFYPTAEIKKLL